MKSCKRFYFVLTYHFEISEGDFLSFFNDPFSICSDLEPFKEDSFNTLDEAEAFFKCIVPCSVSVISGFCRGSFYVLKTMDIDYNSDLSEEENFFNGYVDSSIISVKCDYYGGVL